ncbi:hypothetical protein BH09PLA1_BH09PLA1_12490 [soil metagenome]
MTRIGFFDSGVETSGITRYVRALAGGIDRNEFDVTIFSGAPNLYSDLGVCVVDLNGDPRRADPVAEATSPTFPTSRAFARQAWRKFAPGPVNLLAGFGKGSVALARMFRRHPVDLMHVQIVGADEAAPAARLAGIRRVAGTLHIDSSQSGARRWLMETVTNHCLDRAIAVSAATARDWIRRTALPARLITTIPNGVDTSRFEPKRTKAEARRSLGLDVDGQPLIAAVGRLCEQKGFSFLLDAVARLGKMHAGATIAIAGNGPLRAALLEHARALRIESRVKLLGHMNDVRPLLEAADLVVLPSLWEAMPYSLLEAMSMGLPAIGTRVAGVPEVIDADKTGFLVPPRDAVALAAAIQPLLGDRVRRDSMGRAARQRIIRLFDEREMIATTLRLYRQLLGTNVVEDARKRNRFRSLQEVGR